MSARGTTARLAVDERGAVMVMGVFMAATMAGAMWYVVGIGKAVAFRQEMQDAADSSVFSDAVANAHGMNLIATLNTVMLALVTIHVVLKLLINITGFILTLMTHAPVDSPPGLCLATDSCDLLDPLSAACLREAECTAVQAGVDAIPGLNAVYNVAKGIAGALKPPIKALNNGLTKLYDRIDFDGTHNKALRKTITGVGFAGDAVAVTMPIFGGIQAHRVLTQHTTTDGDTPTGVAFSTSEIPGPLLQVGGTAGVAAIKGFLGKHGGEKDASGKDATDSDHKLNFDAKLGLPVTTLPLHDMCAVPFSMLGDIVSGGIPSSIPQFVRDGIGYFVGTVFHFFGGLVADDVCPTPDPNDLSGANEDQTYWGKSGFGGKAMFKPAYNGSQWMQSWIAASHSPHKDIGLARVGVLQEAVLHQGATGSPQVDVPAYTAEAEFYWDCQGRWFDAACNGGSGVSDDIAAVLGGNAAVYEGLIAYGGPDNVLYDPRWTARLTRYRDPDATRMIAEFVSSIAADALGDVLKEGLTKVVQKKTAGISDPHVRKLADAVLTNLVDRVSGSGGAGFAGQDHTSYLERAFDVGTTQALKATGTLDPKLPQNSIH